MKPTGFILLCFFAGAVAAEEAEISASKHSSALLTAEIRAALPKFQLPTTAAPKPPPDASSDDSEVLELPKITVLEKPPQKMEPDFLLSRAALDKKLKRAYLNALDDAGGITRLLNCFSIPIIGASVTARARAAYFDERISSEWQRLSDLAGVVKEIDAAESAKLKRDLDLSKLPGG